jgi:hypothetical protein
MWSTAAAALILIGICTTTASAHTAPITANCQTGLTVTLTDYNADGVNTLRVWIDGAERATTTFGASASVNYAFGDLTTTHTWRVVVSAFDDPSGANGWSFDTGTSTVPVCAETATTVASSPATTAPATTAPVATAPATTAPAVTPAPTTVPVPPTVASAVITTPSGPGAGPVVSSVVAQAAPTSVVPAGGALPVTGATDTLALGLALLMFGFGILLIVATRRPDSA